MSKEKYRKYGTVKIPHLNWSIAISFSILLLILLLSLSFASGAIFKKIANEDENRLIGIITGIIADSINRISFSGKYHSQLLIDQICESQPDLSYVIVADKKGEIIAQNLKEKQERLNDQQLPLSKVVIKDKSTMYRDVVFNDKRVREIIMPYRSGYKNKITGVIFVGVSVERTTQLMANLQKQINTLIIVIAFVSLVATYFVSSYLAAPVRGLALKLKGILDHAPMLICFTDRNSKISECSRSFFSSSETIQNDLLKYNQESVATSSFEVKDLAIDEKDENHYFLSSSFIVQKEHHDIKQACLFALDVTENKKIEKALIENEERFQVASRQSLLLVYEYHVQSGVIHWSGAIEEVTGYTVAEFNEFNIDKWGQHVHPEDYQRVNTTLKTAEKNIGPFRAEYRFRIKDGSYLYIEDVGRFFDDQNTGKSDRMFGSMRNITDRKLAEQALKESEENLKITLNSIGEAVIVVDNNGKISRMNPVAEDLTGWPYEECSNLLIFDVFKVYDKETKSPTFTAETDKIKKGVIIEPVLSELMVRRDTSECLVSYNGAPIKDVHGNIIGMVLVFRDVTEKFEMEQQLSQSQKMDSIGQLAGGIAHDFNNMLSGILGFADLLTMKLEKNTSLWNYAEKINKTANRAANLTGKLLAFSRKGIEVSRDVDIHHCTNEAIEILSRSIDKRISLEANLDASNSIIHGNAAVLQNVILNLGINARDALPGGGSIEISTRNIYLDNQFCQKSPFKMEPGNFLLLSVKDNGIGIEKENLNRIFDPFYTTKEVGKGTGLGLTTVYRYVIEYHGGVFVESNLGEGTTFNVFLPNSDLSIAEVNKTKQLFKGQGTILVIDDEEVVRFMISEFLQELGYEVFQAVNGQEGVERYKEHKDKINLVILDMVMPVMNGKDCLKHLKQITPEIKVILASGYSRFSSMNEMLEEGACAFLQKPFDNTELSKIVASLIAQK